MSTLATNAITDASGGNTATINSYTPTESNMAGRNRIINGDMRIDQRNAGASVTPTTVSYTLDRWQAIVSVTSKFSVQQNAGAVTPPAGFTDYLGATSLSAYSVDATNTFALAQSIEGFNVSDLAWGTANAQPVTISFWVRSSLTGTFGGALRNSANDRSYPLSYTINAANTWEQKTITVAGDTSGTWLTTSSVGVQIIFGLGSGSTRSGTAGAWASTNYTNATGATSVVGTSGATFYITGVQLEAGSVATPFERRQYGQELALCQRYYQVVTNGAGGWVAAARCDCSMAWSAMRAAPTIVADTVALTCTDYSVANYVQSSWSATSTSLTVTGGTIQFVNFTGSAAGRPGGLANATTNRVLLSAEL